jgi:hypothetical protein
MVEVAKPDGGQVIKPRHLLVLVLVTLVAAPTRAEPILYGVWWEVPSLQEGYLAAAMENRRHCQDAAVVTTPELAKNFHRFGADKQHLWSRPIGEVLDTYLAQAFGCRPAQVLVER